MKDEIFDVSFLCKANPTTQTGEAYGFRTAQVKFFQIHSGAIEKDLVHQIKFSIERVQRKTSMCFQRSFHLLDKMVVLTASLVERKESIQRIMSSKLLILSTCSTPSFWSPSYRWRYWFWPSRPSLNLGLESINQILISLQWTVYNNIKIKTKKSSI